MRVAREFNSYFSTVAVPNPSVIRQSPQNIPSSPVCSMMLSPVDVAEVASVVQNFKTKKSSDINGMSVWLIKRCLSNMLIPLTKLINCSFEQGIFPSSLKTAKVIPIYKKDDPCVASNYRPICILPVLSKVFEKVFLRRFEQFITKHSILYPEQYGFRRNKSTIDAVTRLIDHIVDGVEKREHVLSVFLDLSKAFDCVHHATLLHQLWTSGVRGLPHKWLSSYLSDRDQCVQISNAMSDKVKMPYGVPQGSILGPVLFLIYVNSMNSSIQNGKMIQYADDTTLCIRSKTIQDLEVKTFIELSICIEGFSNINLQTNKSKSNVVHFNLRQQAHEYRPIVMVDDAFIENVESVKFLGMHLDRGLTWDSHVGSICSRVASGIYVLRNLAKLCSLDVLKTAYYGLIYPHLSYGVRLWGGCSKSRLDRVFRMQKKAVRIISKLKHRESCKNAFRELGLLTLPCLYVLEVVLYCRFKCELVQNRDIHRHRTRGRDNFRVQQHRTALFEHLPSQFGVKLLNKLPEEIKKLNQSKQLKSRLRHHLVSKAFYSVDEFMESRWDEQ